MCVEHEETQHLQIIFLSDLTHGKEIAQQIWTSCGCQCSEMRYASNSVRKDLAVAALALRNLIFMMREDQILSACMDVDLLAQILLAT